MWIWLLPDTFHVGWLSGVNTVWGMGPDNVAAHTCRPTAVSWRWPMCSGRNVMSASILYSWFEVSIFPSREPGRVLWWWWYNASAVAMTASWPVMNPVHHSTLLQWLFTLVPLGFVNICIDKTRRGPQPVGSSPFNQQTQDRQLSFACNLHRIPRDCLQCQEAKLTSVPF